MAASSPEITLRIIPVAFQSAFNALDLFNKSPVSETASRFWRRTEIKGLSE
jgi:hypothetical protein